MADQTNNGNYMVNDLGQILPTRTTRRNIVVVTLMFMWFLIAVIVVKGDATNSLHQSALSWAFATSVGVIFAYVFGAVIDNWNVWKTMTVPMQKQ